MKNKFLRILPALFAVLSLALTANADGLIEQGDWARHANVTQLELPKYGDDYLPDDEIENFWSYHSRFGILKWEGRHYLVTRTEEMNSKLRTDIRHWTGTLEILPAAAAAFPASLPEIPDSVIYDITDILPAVARYFHSRDTSRGNCWAFASHLVGLTAGIYTMEEEEFRRLLASPMARKLSNEEALRPGDVVAFRSPGGHVAREVHGMIYVSGDLVFSKNGAGEGVFRLQDAQEVLYTYGPEMAKVNQFFGGSDQITIFTETYRVQPLSSFVALHGGTFSNRMHAFLDKLSETEYLTLQSYLMPEGDTDDAYQEQWRENNRKRTHNKDQLIRFVDEANSDPDAVMSEEERSLWWIFSARVSRL